MVANKPSTTYLPLNLPVAAAEPLGYGFFGCANLRLPPCGVKWPSHP